MKTKLVYVLTCSPEGNYIEQALLAIWSARYHNPAAHIVLFVDDKTNQLIEEGRNEILKYISERIVIPFEDDSTMMYRSRWIKTSVRSIIDGDFLYIDCDTICCSSLSAVDILFQSYEIGAVGDSNVKFQKDISKEKTCKLVSKLGCNIEDEEYYYSSGVIFCRDSDLTRHFYSLWHLYWEQGYSTQEIGIDQPSFAKADIECGHLIQPMEDIFNCVLYTQNTHLRDSIILHLPSYRLSSFLFAKRTLTILREKGIEPWIQHLVTHIHITYLPFDFHIKHSSISDRIKWIREIREAAMIYGEKVSRNYEDWSFSVRIINVVVFLFKCRLYYAGASLWLIWKRFSLYKKKGLKPNVCSN